MGDNFETVFLPNIFQALRDAVKVETYTLTQKDGSEQRGKVNGPDLFPFVRRCVLRAILDEFVSPQLLQRDPDLLDALKIFQDMVEATTAKAAVLPRILALPSCLWPTERARRTLQQRIALLLQSIWNNNNGSDLGPWSKSYLAEKTEPGLAAEHLIGLVFAGHKNPSIGAAQSFCYLRDELSRDQQLQAEAEAHMVIDKFTSPQATQSSFTQVLLEAKILRACILETMRVTAHTIGALRYVQEDIELPSQVLVTKGETISLAHHSMHMETSIWGKDAATFSVDRPEWNNSDNQTSLGVPVNQYKLTTFSNGIHKCPGEKVALAMMEIMLALLLTNNTQLVGQLPPVSFEHATLAQRDGAVNFSIHVS